MHGLRHVCFAFSVSLAWAAYDIDKVFELKPDSKSFFINSENYPSYYPVGRAYRYQITGPAYYKVKAYCTADIGVRPAQGFILE